MSARSRPMVVAALSTALAVFAIVRLATGLGDDDPAATQKPTAGSVTAALARAQIAPGAGVAGNPFTAPELVDTIRATRPVRARCAGGKVRVGVDWTSAPPADGTRDEALARFKAVPVFGMADAFFKLVRLRTSVARYRVLSPEGRVLGTVLLRAEPGWYVSSLRGCQ